MNKLSRDQVLAITHAVVAQAAEAMGIKSSFFLAKAKENANVAKWRDFIFTRVVRAGGQVMLKQWLMEAARALGGQGWSAWPRTAKGGKASGGRVSKHIEFASGVQELGPEDHALFVVGISAVRSLMPQMNGDCARSCVDLQLDTWIGPAKEQPAQPKPHPKTDGQTKHDADAVAREEVAEKERVAAAAAVVEQDKKAKAEKAKAEKAKAEKAKAEKAKAEKAKAEKAEAEKAEAEKAEAEKAKAEKAKAEKAKAEKAKAEKAKAKKGSPNGE